MRRILRVTGSALVLFAILWLLANAIISLKRESINEMVIRQINRQVRGTVSIGDLSPDYFRTFPNISIRLSDVSVTDSLIDIHHHDFLKADRIYARIQLLSLVRGKPKIGKIIVEDCFIYLFTDECGYTNLNRKNDVSFNKGDADIPEFTFTNTRITIENLTTNAYHDIQADYLDCDIAEKDSSLLLHVYMSSLIHGIGFNLAKGSYLKEKRVDGKFTLRYYPGRKMEINNTNLKIERHPYLINGEIIFDTDTMSYDLHIRSKKILYKNGVDLLTESLQQKLDSVDIAEPIDTEATIAGKMAPRVVPRITTLFSVKESAMETTLGHLEHCTFNGSFNNHVDSLLKPGDENSKFIFNNVYAVWSGIQLTSTRIEISNLIHPFLICDLQSSFDLTHLNDLTESSTIRFTEGIGNLDIRYQGSLMNYDTIRPLANGTLSLNNAAFKYIPRNLLFENSVGVIEFKHEDLIIRNLTTTSGSTNLTMSGNINHFLAMVNIHPEQLTMEWNISTPHLNLHDFISYVAPKAETVKKSSRKNKLIRATENVDKLLSDGIAVLNITAEKLTYKNFTATNTSASIRMVENKILLNNASLNHAGGLVMLNGSLINGNQNNQVALESTIKNVDIPAIFRAFDNFGQDGITHTNMRGQMSAKIKASGSLTDNATIIENSIRGTVDFSVRNGELINFEPVMKISETAFKNRDFSHIRFSELDNHFEINGSAIGMDKMEIRSNVVVLFVEGVYDTKKGTDMSIQVPLSNLSKEENEDLQKTGRSGVNIRLWAKTQEDGKLKISWDPFNKASRARNGEK